MPARRTSSRFARHWTSKVKPKTLVLGDGRSVKFRSSFESYVAEDIEKHGRPVQYETERLVYTSQHVYKPDFKLGEIYIEAKGRFEPKDRTKMLAVMAFNPNKDIRFLFQNPNLKLRKGSKTTYAQWAEKHGFKWAQGPRIPESWYEES